MVIGAALDMVMLKIVFPLVSSVMLQVLEKTRLRVSIICQFSLEDSAKGELSPVGTARNVKETRIKKMRKNGWY